MLLRTSYFISDNLSNTSFFDFFIYFRFLKMYCTRASLERRILELVSVAVEAEDDTNPWYAIRNESIAELVSGGNILSDESLGFVCMRSKKTPCL